MDASGTGMVIMSQIKVDSVSRAGVGRPSTLPFKVTLGTKENIVL